MERLYSYGTLQLESVQIDTFGRTLCGTKDTLLGYQIADIRITDKKVIQSSGTDIHPILRYTGNPADKVEGTIFEITAQELQMADMYEVDDYIRVLANFQSGTTAWVYTAAN